MPAVLFGDLCWIGDEQRACAVFTVDLAGETFLVSDGPHRFCDVVESVVDAFDPLGNFPED